MTAQYLYSSAKRNTALAAIGGDTMGQIEVDLLKQVLVATVASGGGGGGAAAWGSITGTLSAQTDLQTALDAKLNLTGGTMTGQLILQNASATGAVNVSPTWNNAGTDFVGIYGRVTNTASGANSKLIDLGTVAAGSKFWVDLNGYANVDQGGFTTASLRFGGMNTGISGIGGARLDFIVSGVQLSTIDASGLNVYTPRLAAPKFSFNPFGFTGAEIRNGTGTPEGSVSADPGSLYLDNGGGPPYYKNTGTGNTGWVLMT